MNEKTIGEMIATTSAAEAATTTIGEMIATARAAVKAAEADSITRAANDRSAIKRAGSAAKRDLAVLDAAEASGDLVYVTIHANWRRNSTWGLCPRVRLEAEDAAGRVYRSTGYASGCGYDKLSAAVHEAVYDCPPLVRLLIANSERIKAANSRYTCGIDARGAIPKWNFSGAGVDCFLSAFEIGGPIGGFVARHTAERRDDYITISRRG